MKRPILTTALALALGATPTLQAQTQPGIDAMQQAFQQFVNSPGVMMKETHWSRMQEQWTFKFVCEGDTMPVPEALQRLTDAFRDNVRYATACYYYTPQDGPAPFKLKRFERKDEVYGTVTGTARLRDDDYSYMLNFTDMSSGLTSYNMEWHEVAFRDRNGRPFRTIDGCIYRHYGGIWTMGKFSTDDPWELKEEQMGRPVSADDRSKYETLSAQVSYLVNNYKQQKKKGNEKGCDAVVYMLKKLCDGFDGQLTEEQLAGLRETAKPMLGEEYGNERNRMAHRALGSLWKKLVTYRHLGEMRSWNTNVGPFVLPDQRREMEEHYDYGFKQQSQVNVVLTGRTSPSCRLITIQQKHPYWKPYAVDADSGRFTFTMPFLPNQPVEVSDNEGHRMVFFADSVPTDIDLTTMTLRGSALNERFADCQRSLRALESELPMYVDTEDIGDATIMDEAGFQQLASDAHQLQMQFIRENADNIIPAWYIAENYTLMSLDELAATLAPLPSPRPYDSLVTVQPARNRYEGLLKRQPGTLFHDVACIDTAEVSHRLAEYIGHGDYVVLYSWSSHSWHPRSGTKTMKQLMKEHRGQNLRVVGFSTDTDKDDWRRYVKGRKLTFDAHLSFPNPTDKYPDGTPKYPDPMESEFMTAYGLQGTGEAIVFDPDGRILSTGLMGAALLDFVRSLPLK